ncbi:MAG: hypothetical protein ACFE75_07565, partial [Candidatus Hodarchaeota archaeon]
MMMLKNSKKKRILSVVSILIFVLVNIFLMNLSTNQNFDITNQNEDNNETFQNNNLKLHDLASDNIYSGIGAPWNVTHWANRTDYNLDIGFENSS